MTDINEKCNLCDRHSKKHLTSNGFEIDLKKEYVRFQSKKKSLVNSLEPIAGDLMKYGWAVYEGINTRYINIIGNLFKDCRNIMHKTVTHMAWNQLQRPTPIKSRRDQFLISMAYLNADPNKLGFLGSIVSFYKKLLTERLQKIKGFDNSELTEGHLLRNRGDLVEQIPHRDFEAVNRKT